MQFKCVITIEINIGKKYIIIELMRMVGQCIVDWPADEPVIRSLNRNDGQLNLLGVLSFIHGVPSGTIKSSG